MNPMSPMYTHSLALPSHTSEPVAGGGMSLEALAKNPRAIIALHEQAPQHPTLKELPVGDLLRMAAEDLSAVYALQHLDSAGNSAVRERINEVDISTWSNYLRLSGCDASYAMVALIDLGHRGASDLQVRRFAAVDAGIRERCRAIGGSNGTRLLEGFERSWAERDKRPINKD